MKNIKKILFLTLVLMMIFGIVDKNTTKVEASAPTSRAIQINSVNVYARYEEDGQERRIHLLSHEEEPNGVYNMPIFDINVHEYEVTMFDKLSYIGETIEPVFKGWIYLDDGTYYGQGVMFEGDGEDLDYGKNVFTVDIPEYGTYTLTVNFKASILDSYINSLKVYPEGGYNEYELNPTFNRDILSYETTVNHNAKRLKLSIVPSPLSKIYQLQVNSTLVEINDRPYQYITLDDSKVENVIYIDACNREDYTETKQYEIRVKREQSANLSSLDVYLDGKLADLYTGQDDQNPGFEEGFQNYRTYPETNAKTIRVNARTSPLSTIEYRLNGSIIQPNQDIPISPGTSTLYIYVRSQDKSLEKVYTVQVQNPDNNAYLRELYLGSSFRMNPSFKKDTFEYTATVDYSKANVGGVYYPEASNATYVAKLDGEKLEPHIGKWMENGTHNLEITVTSPDKTVTKTYTVKITVRDPIPRNITVINGTADVTSAKVNTTVSIEADEISGKKFMYWSSNPNVYFANVNNSSTIFTMIDQNVEITANYEKQVNYYKVNFSIGGIPGGIPMPYYISGFEYEEGFSYTVPTKAPPYANFASDGWEFLGWKVEGTDTLILPGGKITLNSDITLVDVWEKEELKISRILISRNPDKLKYRIGESIELDGIDVKTLWNNGSYTEIDSNLIKSDPKKDYKFTDSDIGFKTVIITYEEGGQTHSTSFAIEILGSTEYTIKVNNGFSYDGNNNLITKGKKGEIINLTANEPNIGEKFSNWTGNVTFDNDTESMTSFIMPGDDVEISANYTKNDDAVINSVTINPQEIETLPGARVNFSATVTGEENFDNSVTWSVEGGGEGTTINLLGELTISSKETPKSLTVKAIANGDNTKSGTAKVTIKQAEKYTVTFDPGEGGSGAMSPQTIEGNSFTFPDNGFTAPDGKVFGGWFVDGIKYEINSTIYITENITAVAIWKDIAVVEEKVTVSFDSNTGTGTMADVEVKKGSTYTLPGNGFTPPEEKEFKAWEVGGVEKSVGDTITVTENTTVKAIWKDIEDTPEPDSEEPEVPEEKELYNIHIYGGHANLRSAKAGEIITITSSYDRFIKWEGNVVFKDKYDNVTTFEMPAKDVYIDAIFEEYYGTHYSDYYDTFWWNYNHTSMISQPVTKDTRINLQARLWIGSKILEKSVDGNKTETQMDIAPFIVDGRTMVPIRFVAEALAFNVVDRLH